MNKVMIVTGGNRGIGAATAVLAAQRGYAVCVNYVHNRAAATEVVATIVQAGGRAIAAPGDAANEADVGGHATEVAAAVPMAAFRRSILCHGRDYRCDRRTLIAAMLRRNFSAIPCLRSAAAV